MADARLQAQLWEILGDIIQGRIVKRAKHTLLWEGRDVSLEFVDALEEQGYRQTIVRDVAVEPGERVPSFYINDGTAYFGWVFWEKFSQLRLRKLFGSVTRNTSGDWAIQIPSQRNSVIYVNMALKSEMDIDNPSGL